MAAMEQVNTDLNKGSNVTNLGTGISGMVDLDVVLAPVLMAGLRGGYIYCMPASAEYLLYPTTTINASLIPVEAGVTANLEIPNVPLSIMAGIYGGYGFAAASYKYDALGSSATFPYSGNGFIGEAVATINYKLSSSLSLNINGGYRLANIPKLTETEDVSYSILGIPIPVGTKGDVLKNFDGNDLALDFSGFSIGAGFSLGF
jgi:hypothetical protein